MAIRSIMFDLGEAGDAWRKHKQHKTWVDKRRPIWWALEKMTAGLTVAGANAAVDAMDVRRGDQSVTAFILTLDKPGADWFKEMSQSAAP